MGGTTYVGSKALLVTSAVTVLSRISPDGLLGDFPRLYLAKALIKELKGLARYFEGKLVGVIEAS